MRHGWLVLGVLLIGSGSAAAQEQGVDNPVATLFAPVPSASPSSSWASADALFLWVRSAPLPPTLTTFAPGSTSATTGFGGALGVPGTAVISPDHFNYGMFSGARLNLGTWLDCEQSIGVEASGFFVGTQSSHFAVMSDGTFPLRVPFFNPSAGTGFPLGNSSFVLADPGFANGQQAINTSLHFWGAEGNALFQAVNGPCTKVSFLAGFRYLDLQENLDIISNENFVGVSFFGADSFATRNQFYGGQVGVKAQRQFGRFDGTVIGKVALGDNHQTVRIDGFSVNNLPAPFVNGLQPGGIFGEPTNIGAHDRNRFCVVPEFQLQLGMQVTSRLRAFAGYQFLYMSNVIRPGDQIDRVINFSSNPAVSGVSPPTLVGPPRPAPIFSGTDFWAQGVNVGVEFKF